MINVVINKELIKGLTVAGDLSYAGVYGGVDCGCIWDEAGKQPSGGSLTYVCMAQSDLTTISRWARASTFSSGGGVF
jgi:hypothetical protein